MKCLQLCFQILDQHIYANGILAAPWDDDISGILGRLYISIVHGLYSIPVLCDHGFNAAATLQCIPGDPAHDPLIGIGIHKDLEIHKTAELFVFQYQNPFQQNDGMGMYGDGFKTAVVDRIVIYRTLDGLTVFQLQDVLIEPLRIKGVRVVIVQLGALLVRHVVVGEIVAVMADDLDLISKVLPNLLYDGGFSGGGAACNANYIDLSHNAFPFLCGPGYCFHKAADLFPQL